MRQPGKNVIHGGKTETLTVRLRPEDKERLREAAEREQRSLSNMLEVILREWPGHRASGDKGKRDVARG